MLLKINAKARFELTIISDSWLIKHLFRIWCFFAAGRHEFLFDYGACPNNTADFPSPHSYCWDGCLSWLTWKSRCSIRCSGSKILLLIYTLLTSLGLRLTLILWIWDHQVVSSRQWPLISRYRAAVCTQSPKLEMIDSLHKKVSDTEDEGLFR